MMRKRVMPLAVLMAAGAVTLSAGHAVASPATRTSARPAADTGVIPASTKDGVCEPGEFWPALDPGAAGLVLDTAGGDSNMSDEGQHPVGPATRPTRPGRGCGLRQPPRPSSRPPPPRTGR